MLIAYAVLVHCVAFLMLFIVTRKLGALSASIINLTQPVSASLLGILIFGNRIGPLEFLGALLVAVAIWQTSLHSSASSGD
jgi:drug/metabolite transporter (DMT)-like permease